MKIIKHPIDRPREFYILGGIAALFIFNFWFSAHPVMKLMMHFFKRDTAEQISQFIFVGDILLLAFPPLVRARFVKQKMVEEQRCIQRDFERITQRDFEYIIKTNLDGCIIHKIDGKWPENRSRRKPDSMYVEWTSDEDRVIFKCGRPTTKGFTFPDRPISPPVIVWHK